MQPLISFVIPVYNTGKYLKRCLDSIVLQTYKVWEAILVDDGSTDGSGGICDEYAAGDQRFHVIHQVNGGQPKARNAGIRKARGKYIAFVDSDDWIDKMYLEFLVDRAECEKLDMVMCHCTAEYPGGKSIELERMDIKERVARGTEIEFFKLYSYSSGFSKEKYGFFNTSWGKLYKTDVLRVNALCFNDEAKMIEDQLFQSEFLEFAGSIGIYKKILYHYRMSDASAAHRFRRNYLEDAAAFLEHSLKLIDKYHKEEVYKERYYNLVCSIIILILKCYFFHPDYPQSRAERRNGLNNLLLTEPYRTALLKKDRKALKNSETRVLIKLLQLHFWEILSMYFKMRLYMKKLYVWLKGKRSRNGKLFGRKIITQ